LGETSAVLSDPAFAYRDQLSSAAQRAMRAAGGPIVHDLRLGGAHVRLRLAGSALESVLVPALRHARIDTPASEPELTIDAWDARSTGVGPPAFPWRAADVRERGEIHGFNNDAIRTLYHAGGPGPGKNFHALSMVDTVAGTAWFSVASAECVPWYERAAPLRAILHLGLHGPGRLLVHAAALGRLGTGMLLAGGAGAGKSTTALACVLAGLDYAGDDYVVLDLRGATPTAHSIYGTAKVVPSTTALLPELAARFPEVAGEDREKLVVDLAGTWAERMRASIPVSVVVLPVMRSGPRATLTPCSPATALRALAPTTIHQLPSVGGSALAQLSELVRRVPAYSLGLGSSPQAAAAVLVSMLEELDGGV
jgi:hypothetical protein